MEFNRIVGDEPVNEIKSKIIHTYRMLVKRIDSIQDIERKMTDIKLQLMEKKKNNKRNAYKGICQCKALC